MPINASEKAGLRERIAQLEAELLKAQAVIRTLQEKLAALQRAGKRQATPFARRARVEQPKRPGRKRGRGTFSQRAKPAAADITETKRAALSGCPDCGCALEQLREHEQFEIDLPEVQPQITRYIMLSGKCPQCGKRHRLTHPTQISGATGAAGVVIGPRAKAFACDLKHRLGASYGKVCEVLSDAFNLRVTRSAWCQADQRLKAQAQPIYQDLVKALQTCLVVHSDETGWRIGALSAWLWVFTNQQLTVYTIKTSRAHEVVVTILGKAFKGVLVCDCFRAYDHHELADWLQQKCLSHLLKDLKELHETKTGGAVRFARDLATLLQEALALKKQKAACAPEPFAQHAAQLEARLDALIATQRHLTDPDNARFAKRLRKQRPHVLRFLYVDELEATNNQAERMLRPAVITRKTNGCNRTDDGAETHAILSSLLVTCRQQAIPILDYFVKLQRFGETPQSLTACLSPPL